MRLNNPKILNTIDAILGDETISEKALYALRYRFTDRKTSRKDLKNALTGLNEFLNSFPSVRVSVKDHFFPVSGEQVSLHGSVIFLTHRSDDRFSVRVYSPEYALENTTVHLENTCALPFLKDELSFMQHGEFVEYDKLNHNSEIIAISKQPLCGSKKHVVLHYAP